MMKNTILAVCVLAGTAVAQPGDPQPPVETPPPPPPIEQPPQPPQPPHPQPRVEQPPPPVVAEPPPLVRPAGFSLGIGVGYRFPTSLQTPNITSVRFRLAGGITVEPSVVFATTSHSEDTGTAQTSRASEAGVGVLGRFPLISHRRTDLELLGGVAFDYLGQDPDDQNSDDVTTNTTVTVSYGLAVGLWLTPHVQASLSATNGLVSFAKKREEMGAGSVRVTNDTTFGLIFDPTVAFMIHLFN
jgi:hypothetical protein